MENPTDGMESHIYKVILANYSELNDFILYNHPNISRRGTSDQGIDIEVIPNFYKWHGIFGSYAVAIKEIREELLRKSVYFRGSFESFQKEFDPILSLYSEILSDINAMNGVLSDIPIFDLIRKFLLSLDAELHTNNYFFNKLAQLHLSRSLTFYDLDDKPIKDLEIIISSLKGNKILRTDGKGLVKCCLDSGTYLIKTERFHEEKTLEINEFDKGNFDFVLNIRKSGFFRRYKPVRTT